MEGISSINLIELPDSKRPHEADRVVDPLYCPEGLGTIPDCFVLKR